MANRTTTKRRIATKRPTAHKRITKPTNKVWGIALQDVKKGQTGWYSAKPVPGRRAKL